MTTNLGMTVTTNPMEFLTNNSNYNGEQTNHENKISK